MFRLLSEEHRLWLVNIQNVITSEYGRARSLSEEEWAQIQKLITAHRLPCALSALAYGFGMLVYDHSQGPGHPPERVLAIEYSQLPSMAPGPAFQNLALDYLEPLVNSADNRWILRHYGIEVHENLTSYIY